MRIKDMFERDIDRSINGVIKMDVSDEDVLEQELSEYVVTHELAGHFKDFYSAYERVLDHPTDKIGVWISGFFGSGKSHFLKMLSYLLENREVKGRSALDYFAKKFEDPQTLAIAQRCADVPTEAILFNIDLKANGKKDEDVIKRTFASVFYEHLGFYGKNLKVAELEMLIDQDGKTDAFRAAYESETGKSWVDDRKKFKLRKAKVRRALVSSGVMEEEETASWLTGSDESVISIESFVDQVKAYVDSRVAEFGDFRLLFMVDEMGQFIGSDSSLMLNLQTIVEELGTRCAGRVWVMVTSQEAIDSVTKVVGNDFSKIQGRFNTRISMSSSNVDEVIKRRVLAKTPDAQAILETSYADNEASLKNLFSFQDAVGDLVGYEGSKSFSDSFPFADYQFKLVQDVLNELRKQGNSGKHTSSGERSMLNGFQEATQTVEDRDQNTLVPFWRFYDTVSSSLESYHRQVINRAAEAAENGQGLEPSDVNVLKALFLIRWVAREIPGNLDNIVTLMVDDVRANRADLRERVQASLDRLVRQNKVAREGETYQFLTDDEQKIAMKILRTDVEPDKLVAKAANIMFGDIFDSSKLSLGKNNFPIAEYLDDKCIHGAEGMTLRVIAGMDGASAPSWEELALRSSGNEAIVVLDSSGDYYGCLLEAARIEKFCNSPEGTGTNEAEAKVISAKQEQRVRLELRAKELMEEGVRRGSFFVLGKPYTPAKSTSPKSLIEDCARQLVGFVYPNLSYIDTNYDNDADIRKVLDGQEQGIDGIAPNARAIEDLSVFLCNQALLNHPVTMGDVQRHYQAPPFGWREQDVAAVAAALIAQRKAKLTLAGKSVVANDPKFIDYLRKSNQVDRVRLELRAILSEGKRLATKQVVEDLCDVHNLPTDEDGLADAARRSLTSRRRALQDLLNGDYRACPDYPGRKGVADAVSLLSEILEVQGDAADFLQAISRREARLEDAAEQLESVDDFFGSQRRAFDDARKVKSFMTRQEREYFLEDEDVVQALKVIDDYLSRPRVMSVIAPVTEATQKVSRAHAVLLQERQRESLDSIEQMYLGIEEHASELGVSLPEIGHRKTERKNSAHDARLITELDALQARLHNDQTELFEQIDSEHKKAIRPKPATTNVTLTSKPRPAAAQATASTAPSKRVKKIDRIQVFLPQLLTSEEDIDAYLSKARNVLLEGLRNNDEIRLK